MSSSPNEQNQSWKLSFPDTGFSTGKGIPLPVREPGFFRFSKFLPTAEEFPGLMHSCGYNWAILDDLAEVGINCLQFDQPKLYGLERLAKKLQGLKVCLFSPVDIQKTLPTGNKELIVREAQTMAELFSGGRGGFIAKNYVDLPGIGVREEWDKWAYETFLKLTRQKKWEIQ